MPAALNTPRDKLTDLFRLRTRSARAVPLNWNSQVLAFDGRAQRTDVRIKWLNFADLVQGQSVWSPIVSEFREAGAGWSMHGAFDLVAPATANRPFVVSARNPVDIFRGEVFSADALDVEIVHPDARAVAGVVNDAHEHQVVYPDALGDGIDIKFGLWHGRGPRPEVVYVFRREPSGDGEFVEIVKTITVSRGGTMPGLGKKKRFDISAGGGIVSEADPRRGLGIKPASCWYTDRDGVQHRERCELIVTWLSKGKVQITKRVPRAMIRSAIAAGVELLADTTTTVYPDANTETTSVDGYTYRDAGVGESWSVLRSGNGTSSNDSASVVSVLYANSLSTTDSFRYCNRGLFVFDTSVIGSGQTVSSATFGTYGSSVTTTLGGSPLAGVYSCNPASNTSIAASDHQTCGTTLLSDTIAFSSLSTSGYNTHSLTDLSVVSVTDRTKLSLREKTYDADGGTYTWSTTKANQYRCYMSDQTGTTNDPKLVVEHAAAATGKPTFASSYRRHRQCS